MNTDDKLEKRHKAFMKYDGNDVISLLIHACELQADMLAEVKRLREVLRDIHYDLTFKGTPEEMNRKALTTLSEVMYVD